MKPSGELQQIRQAINTLQNMPEHETEVFRIVLTTLRQKEEALLSEVALKNA